MIIETDLVKWNKLPLHALAEWQADGTDVDEDLLSWLHKLDEIQDRRRSEELKLESFETELYKATAEQERLIKLVGALDRNDAPRERFVKKLAELESKIEDVRPEIAGAKETLIEIRELETRHRETVGESQSDE